MVLLFLKFGSVGKLVEDAERAKFVVVVVVGKKAFVAVSARTSSDAVCCIWFLGFGFLCDTLVAAFGRFIGDNLCTIAYIALVYVLASCCLARSQCESLELADGRLDQIQHASRHALPRGRRYARGGAVEKRMSESKGQ